MCEDEKLKIRAKTFGFIILVGFIVIILERSL